MLWYSLRRPRELWRDLLRWGMRWILRNLHRDPDVDSEQYANRHADSHRREYADSHPDDCSNKPAADDTNQYANVLQHRFCDSDAYQRYVLSRPRLVLCWKHPDAGVQPIHRPNSGVEHFAGGTERCDSTCVCTASRTPTHRRRAAHPQFPPPRYRGGVDDLNHARRWDYLLGLANCEHKLVERSSGLLSDNQIFPSSWPHEKIKKNLLAPRRQEKARLSICPHPAAHRSARRVLANSSAPSRSLDGRKP